MSWLDPFFQTAVTYPSGSGSCAVTFSSTIPSSLNLSTSPLATRDWFAPGGTGQINYRANVVCHSKILGCDQIRGSFDFVGSAAANVSKDIGDGVISLTTAAGDDQYVSLLSNTSGTQGPIDGTNSALGWGYAFRVPADTFSRTLTIYGGSYSCGLTLTATASDGSFAPVTNVVSGTANTGENTAWTITYSTARDGQYLSISVLCTTNLGGSPNIAFTCAMLS
jgi:hypothetical protein